MREHGQTRTDTDAAPTTPAADSDGIPSCEAVVLIAVWGTSLLSRLISRITNGPSHVAVGFTSETEAIYFEALFGDGVIGPRPFGKVLGYVRDHAGSRMCIVPLPIPVADIPECRAIAQSYVGVAGYNAWQLVLQWQFERFGIRVPPSPNSVVCCEYVAIVVRRWIDLRSEGRSFDETTPGSVYRKALADAANRQEQIETGNGQNGQNGGGE